MRKRLFALVLVLALILCAAPLTAYAADYTKLLTPEEAKEQIRASAWMNDALKERFVAVLDTYVPNSSGFKHTEYVYANNGKWSAKNCAGLALYTYYSLFGYYYGRDGAADSYLKLQGAASVSYEDFVSNGIYPGAHIRTGPNYNVGHSMILVDYNETYIWVYEANKWAATNTHAGIDVAQYTWNEFNAAELTGRDRTINNIGVPKNYAALWQTGIDLGGIGPGAQGQTALRDIIKALANKARPSGAASVQAHSTLRSGSRGGEVKTLQTMLNAVSGAGLAVDGGFGSKTLAAVKSFQRARGLAVDGVVGAKTWAALEAEYNKPEPEPAAPTPTPVQPDPEPAAPDPAPAPDQSGKISFMPSALALVPVTEPTQGMPQGQPFYFKGSILSNYPIVFARVAILTADRVDAIQSKNIQPNSTLVDIATSGLDSLKFGKLQPGSYVLYLTATDSSGAVKEWSADFSIAASHATVRKGSKGDEVRLLQTMLNQIMGAGLDVDGGFGAKTLAAVKSYQSSRGLAADGVVGPKTWAALESEYRR